MPKRAPRRVMARAIALSGIALMGAALFAWTPQPTTGWDQSSAEATLWQLLNGARTNNGLPPLIKHSTLVSLARWRSKDMVDRDYFSHTIKGTSYQVYHWYDTNGLSWSSGGENIGYNNGFSDANSPIKIHEGFMASSGHRANILNSTWSHGGVGAYGKDGAMWGGKVRNIRMYTELFVKLKSAPAPTPAPTPKPPAPTPAPTPKPVVATPKPVVATPKPIVATPKPVPFSTPRQVPVQTATPTPEPTPEATPDQKVARTLPMMLARHVAEGWDPSPASHAIVARSMRVETAAAPDRGIFETVIGSLLSFFLG
ncbi:MAG: CAP domain-containing protein [Chloroflexota bacterium]